MKKLKNKLSSKSGASMLLALVFLMFCMFVGGSVLAAATANGSWAARQKENQQAYLSQRSASLLLADLLKGDENSAMQLTIKDVESSTGRTITFTAHGKGPRSELQFMLYEREIAKYLELLSSKSYSPRYVNFGPDYSYPGAPAVTGGITLSLTSGSTAIDTLVAQYDMTYPATGVDKDLFIIDYAVTPEGGEPQTSYARVSMKRYPSDPYEVTVNGVTTTTTIIRWDDPVIEKGGK